MRKNKKNTKIANDGICINNSGIILGKDSENEKWCYNITYPDSKDHRANMGPHADPMNLAILTG